MLKRIIVLALLFGMMFGLGLLTQGSSGALINASQTLASIGFTALFAFTVGEVFGALKLPRVTGYILTGIVLGPHLGEIFSSEIRSPEARTLENPLEGGVGRGWHVGMAPNTNCLHA